MHDREGCFIVLCFNIRRIANNIGKAAMKSKDILEGTNQINRFDCQRFVGS